MSLINYLNEVVGQSFTKNGFEPNKKLVKLSDRPDLSEFQCNAAFELAKEKNKIQELLLKK